MLKVEKLLERVDLSSELKSYPMATNADDKRGLHGKKGPGSSSSSW